jgi:hypothetical protein
MRTQTSHDHRARPPVEQSGGSGFGRGLSIVELGKLCGVQSTWSASGVGTTDGGFAHVDALDVLKICLRRWYVVLPVVLLSLAAGVGLASQQKPTYTAFGSYALVYHSPKHVKEGEDPTEPNPLATDGAVVLGEALVADFMSGASQTTLGGVGNSGTAPREAKDGTSYTVDLPDGSQSYVVQTWGPDPESLRRVVDSVLAAAPQRAAQIQERAGAPTKSQYTTFVTGSTQLTKLPLTSTPKLIVAMLGVGILAGSALSLVVDRLLRSRKDRAARRVPPVRERSIDEPTPDGYDSHVVMTLPRSSAVPAQPDAYEPKPVMTAVAELKPTKVHTKHAEEASVATATRLPAKGADAVSADVAEQAQGQGPEEMSVVEAEELPADQADEVPVDPAAEVTADRVTEVPADEAAQAAEQAQEMSVGEVEKVSANGAAEKVPADQSLELPTEGAEERSRVNSANGEPRHGLEPQPLTEYTAGPGSTHGNDESIPDSDLWPLLEHQGKFDAEGVTDDHTRDRQPAR